MALSLDHKIDALNRVIDNLIDGRHTTELLERIGQTMLTDVQMNFRQQRDPDGNPWAKTRRGGQILSDTRRLRNSIQYEVSGDEVHIGTSVLYAPVHQFGATIKPKRSKYLVFDLPGGGKAMAKEVTIPARPFIGIGERQMRKIDKLLDDWLASLD